MNDYSEFPPFNSFKRVLTHCPHTALLYASIWKHTDKSGRISVKKSEIKQNFLISPTLFRNHLLAIGRLDLITFEETSNFFLIDFYENHAK